MPEQFLDVDRETITGALNKISRVGQSTAFINEMGALVRTALGTAISPGATGADNVLAVYSIPALLFDQAGRGIRVKAAGSFATGTNTKQVKIIFNPSTAVVGSTVGSGGTVIADTGSYSTTGTPGFSLEGLVVKYGALASNTQWAMQLDARVAATNPGVAAPVLATATESAAILVAVTGNAGTTATDILLSFFEVLGLN